MDIPSRVVDLHTHLFNARYIPISGVIARAMNKDDSILARVTAKLIWALTGSDYVDFDREVRLARVSDAGKDEHYINAIWRVTQLELLKDAFPPGEKFIQSSLASDIPFSPGQLDTIRQSSIVAIINELDSVDIDTDSYKRDIGEDPLNKLVLADASVYKKDFLPRYEGIVKSRLSAIAKFIKDRVVGEAENIFEFIHTMLLSEEKVVRKIMDMYGSDINLQILHLMMDMEKGYKAGKPHKPKYDFFPTQMHNMELLQSAHPGKIFGFSAFDPRNPDWIERFEQATRDNKKYFRGFKFYPAMGFKPSGNEESIQKIIDAFYDLCIEHDVAVFTHCTPVGFEAFDGWGLNANPLFWEEVLKERPTLRLCLGHAGGGKMEINPNRPHNEPAKFSWGWEATDATQWEKDNYANVVARLCKTYENVYCETGNYLWMLTAPDGPKNFLGNLKRVVNEKLNYNFMDKLCYGTDWHMPDMVDNARHYFDKFLLVTKDPLFEGHRDKFFWKNAYAFLREDPYDLPRRESAES